MENLIKNNEEKIWGLYPGFLKAEEIVELEEIDVWKQINDLSEYIYWNMMDMEKPWINTPTQQEMKEKQYSLEFLVYYTRHYGVEFSKEPNAKEHIERNISFISWFGFWKQHFTSMPRERYNEFIDAKFLGQDISRYLPVGNWKDLYKKSKTKRR